MTLQDTFDTYAASSDIVTRINDNNTVIIMKMDDSDSFFKIRGIAALFWPVFEKKTTFKEVLDNTLSNYETTEEQLSEDLQKFVDKLISLNFIVKQ